jgi:hypothetical protein
MVQFLALRRGEFMAGDFSNGCTSWFDAPNIPCLVGPHVRACP